MPLPTRRAAVLAAPALLLALAGCGPADARLKGKLVNGPEPVGSGGRLVSLSFHPVTGGTPDPKKCYTAPLDADGSFEFVASGGTLPPGEYRVVVAAAGGSQSVPAAGKAKAGPDRFDGVNTLAASKLSATLAAGQNDITVDLAKGR